MGASGTGITVNSNTSKSVCSYSNSLDALSLTVTEIFTLPFQLSSGVNDNSLPTTEANTFSLPLTTSKVRKSSSTSLADRVIISWPSSEIEVSANVSNIGASFTELTISSNSSESSNSPSLTTKVMLAIPK